MTQEQREENKLIDALIESYEQNGISCIKEIEVPNLVEFGDKNEYEDMSEGLESVTDTENIKALKKYMDILKKEKSELLNTTLKEEAIKIVKDTVTPKSLILDKEKVEEYVVILTNKYRLDENYQKEINKQVKEIGEGLDTDIELCVEIIEEIDTSKAKSNSSSKLI